MANSVDTDQTPRSATSDLCLHCLLRPVSEFLDAGQMVDEQLHYNLNGPFLRILNSAG